MVKEDSPRGIPHINNGQHCSVLVTWELEGYLSVSDMKRLRLEDKSGCRVESGLGGRGNRGREASVEATAMKVT